MVLWLCGSRPSPTVNIKKKTKQKQSDKAAGARRQRMGQRYSLGSESGSHSYRYVK